MIAGMRKLLLNDATKLDENVVMEGADISGDLLSGRAPSESSALI
jgi:hypothetical protein